MDDRWVIIACVTIPTHLFHVNCLDGIYLRLQLFVGSSHLYGQAFTLTLVPGLEVAEVIFKLGDLYPILVNTNTFSQLYKAHKLSK